MCLLAVSLAVPASAEETALWWYFCMSHIEKRHPAASEAIPTAAQDHVWGGLSLNAYSTLT